jgi:SsrA-binding protein
MIANNKKALHDYFIENKYTAGIVLLGWEIKAIRQGRVQLKDSYVRVKNGELWLIGCHISPLLSASTHITPDAIRSKKLLLHKREITRLIGKVEQRGYSVIALNLHYSNSYVKVEIGLAKGKKQYDKRSTIKEKDLQREQAQMVKRYNRV